MVHRVIFGSLERFMAILIEHYGGAFPVWLAPIQVLIITIADRHSDYATSILDKLVGSNIRAQIDDRNERMNSKIREAQLQKIPYMFVVGDREIEVESVGVRSRTEGDLGMMTVDEVLRKMKDEIEPVVGYK